MNKQELFDNVTNSALSLTSDILNLLLDKSISAAVEIEGVEVISLDLLKAMINSIQKGLGVTENG